jgi:hypothetical protein
MVWFQRELRPGSLGLGIPEPRQASVPAKRLQAPVSGCFPIKGDPLFVAHPGFEWVGA